MNSEYFFTEIPQIKEQMQGLQYKSSALKGI